MQIPFRKCLPAFVAAMAAASFAISPYADAAGRGGGGGGRAASGGGGGGGGQRASSGGGGSRQAAQVNNSRADVRTTDVRSNSVNNVNATNVNRNVNNVNVNNVNVNRNVNVNVDNHGGWDNDYHPVARAAAVGATVAVTAAVVGSMVPTVPASCVPVNYGGMVYQQCGATWYQPQGPQYVVVNPPY